MLAGVEDTRCSFAAGPAFLRVLVLAVLVLAPRGATSAETTERVWEDVSLGLPTSDLAAIVSLPEDPSVALVAGSGLVYRTDDAGDTWRMVLRIGGSTRGRGVLARALRDDGTIDTDGLAEEILDELISEYEGEATDAVRRELEIEARREARRAEARLRRDVERAGADLTAARASDRRIRRIRAPAGSDGRVYLCTERGLFVSTDKGVTFAPVRLGGGPSDRVVSDVATMPNAIAVATEGGILLFRPGHPVRRSVLPQRGRSVRALVWHHASRRLIAATGDGLLESANGGATFRVLHVPAGAAQRRVRDLAITEGGAVIFAATGQGLLVSRDGGRRFSAPWIPGLGSTAVARISAPAKKGAVLAATDRGVFRSTDAGRSFSELRRGLSDPDVRDVHVVDSTQNTTVAAWLATRTGAYRLVAPTDVRRERQTLKVLERYRVDDPPLNDVLRVATSYARLDSEVADALIAMDRWGMVGPTVRFEHGQRYRRRVENPDPIDPIIPLLGEEIDVIPGAKETRLEIYFDLAQMLFDPDERVLEDYRERVVKKRRRLRKRVADMYTARHELMLSLLSARKRARSWHRRLQRLQTLTAVLDGLTAHRLRWVDPAAFLSSHSEPR